MAEDNSQAKIKRKPKHMKLTKKILLKPNVCKNTNERKVLNNMHDA